MAVQIDKVDEQSARLMNSVNVHEHHPAPSILRTQEVLNSAKMSALDKYRLMMVGRVGFLGLLKYELLTGLLSGMPGLAGLALRAVSYRLLFKRLGRGVAIGQNVTIRRPDRIQIEDGVIISDNVTLDAKGDTGAGIILRKGAFIGQGTIISMGGGTIEIAEGANIGSNCRIGTLGTTRIGRKSLIAAYVYIVGGGHQSNQIDIPIIDQPSESRGGAEIGDGCWIGAFTMVMDGTRVGHDAIVGAHSLVTRDIPPFAVAYGIPARVQRDRRDTNTG